MLGHQSSCRVVGSSTLTRFCLHLHHRHDLQRSADMQQAVSTVSHMVVLRHSWPFPSLMIFGEGKPDSPHNELFPSEINMWLKHQIDPRWQV